MKNTTPMVLVVARKNAILEILSGPGSPLKGPCGASGKIIAREVLDGGGRALVEVSKIRMAIDTIDGVNAIFDNFDLVDKDSGMPIVHKLMKGL
ncbi:hypothetical protein [Xanthomonas nasturtii]|uniref:hypothetical protein n=1 Tax=Xanthomonas nasturtii TaxID=1843581 RepID=UPI001290760D|nr:hypothetical protein [Xanthomonas nasturtii]WVL56654.1 hypothetical protein M3O54_020590 [Xanthomonas nasturtii]